MIRQIPRNRQKLAAANMEQLLSPYSYDRVPDLAAALVIGCWLIQSHKGVFNPIFDLFDT